MLLNSDVGKYSREYNGRPRQGSGWEDHQTKHPRIFTQGTNDLAKIILSLLNKDLTLQRRFPKQGKVEGKKRTTSSKLGGLNYSGDKYTIGRPKGPG